MGESMGQRYRKQITLNMDEEYVENAIKSYLKQNEFTRVYEQGEAFYRTEKWNCLKYTYYDGVLQIEAWFGTIGKEMDISDGRFLGSNYKVPYYSSLLSFLGKLEKERQMEQYNTAQSSKEKIGQPHGIYEYPNSDLLEEMRNVNDKNAVIAFWLSIIGLFLAFEPKLSMLVNVGTYYLAFNYGLKSGKSGMAKAAIVINTIAILIAIKIIFGRLFE
jgi:hypothetical protein